MRGRGYLLDWVGGRAEQMLRGSVVGCLGL